MSELTYKVQQVREANNVLWMDLLRLALEVAPDRAKGILRQINANDSRIRDYLKQIGES